MSSDQASDIQQRMYKFIVSYMKSEKMPPTNREIGREMHSRRHRGDDGNRLCGDLVLRLGLVLVCVAYASDGGAVAGGDENGPGRHHQDSAGRGGASFGMEAGSEAIVSEARP